MPKPVKVLVKGRVQGVFFRKNTQQKAHQLGLTGYVKNLPDGRVEIVAQGPQKKISELIDWAKEGPKSARVEDLTIENLESEKDFSKFKIIR